MLKFFRRWFGRIANRKRNSERVRLSASSPTGRNADKQHHEPHQSFAGNGGGLPESRFSLEETKWTHQMEPKGSSRSPKRTSIDIVMGLDFGTSSTKVVVRAPYLPGSPAFALPVPGEVRAEGRSHLWESAVWYDVNRQTFSAEPKQGSVKLEGIKAAFINDPASLHHKGVQVLDTCVAFLAFVIQETVAWSTRKSGFQGHSLQWSVNLGLPAATFDTPILGSYRDVLYAAWRLAGRGDTLTIMDIQKSLGEGPTDGADSFHVIPEVAAAVAGFSRSQNRRDGLYILADVGAATLDVCSFRLSEPVAGLDRYSMLLADVQPLGVAATTVMLKKGKTVAEIKNAVFLVVTSLIWQTKLHRDPNAVEWRSSLPLFICGGGAANKLHRNAMNALTPWLNQHTDAEGVPINSLVEPDSLSSDDNTDLGRLVVAWGLSYPEIEIGDLIRPSEIEDIPRISYRDISDHFVSKDQV